MCVCVCTSVSLDVPISCRLAFADERDDRNAKLNASLLVAATENGSTTDAGRTRWRMLTAPPPALTS